MRPYLFFILALALAIINSSVAVEVFAYAKNNNKIQISATVLEQLTYKKNGVGTLAETNYEKGFMVIDENPALTIIIVKL